MNVLSFGAIVVTVLYAIVMIKQYQASTSNDRLGIFAMLVLATLGWWSLCDAFFYSAPSKEAAWFFHHLSSIGWCGFASVTTYYFMIMVGLDKKMNIINRIIYWGSSLVIMIASLMLKTTPLASDIVQSTSGLGWTYIQRFDSVWTYIYLVYIAICMGGTLFYLYFWQKKQEKNEKKTLAKGFIIIDTLSLVFGIIVSIIMPSFSSYLPPLSFIAFAIFLYGYSNFLWDYDLEHIKLALDPAIIFDNSIESLVITDIYGNIVYQNQAAKRLLKWDGETSFKELFDLESQDVLVELTQNYHKNNQTASLTLASDKSVILSLNKIQTRRGKINLFIFTLQDISQIHKAQVKMEYLANYDELTGLPNRRYFGELLDNFECEANKHNRDFVLLFSDLNYFKNINDTYGHDVGDQALIETAKAIKSAILSDSVVARLSGDEFVVLQYVENSNDVENCVENIKKAVSAIDLSNYSNDIKMDIAIGSCLYSECKSVRVQLKTADYRMYQIKRDER